MKTLLLTSEGTCILDQVRKVFPKPPQKVKLAYVPTAAYGEDDPSYTNEEQEELRKEGYIVTELDIREKTQEEIRAVLSQQDGVWVSGGNTYYLLDHVRKSGFDKVIKELIEQGLVYIGVSAGSIIAGTSIKVCNFQRYDANKIGLQDLTGMSLLPFDLFVHYTDEWKNTVIEGKRELYNSGEQLRILTDDQAFLVLGDEVTLVGTGSEVIIEELA